jgi:trimeric autotransporter adhesin
VRLLAVALLFIASGLAAAEYTGQVAFNGLAVPGVTVTATLGDKKLATLTDTQGLYSFPDLPEGTWIITTEMTGFAPITRQVTVAGKSPADKWELQLLPFDQVKLLVPMGAHIATVAPIAKPAPATQTSAASEPVPKEPATKEPKQEDENAASDGFLINGSSNNGAASPFSQFPGIRQ